MFSCCEILVTLGILVNFENLKNVPDYLLIRSTIGIYYYMVFTQYFADSTGDLVRLNQLFTNKKSILNWFLLTHVVDKYCGLFTTLNCFVLSRIKLLGVINLIRVIQTYLFKYNNVQNCKHSQRPLSPSTRPVTR